MIRTARQSRSCCSEILRRNIGVGLACAVFSSKRPLNDPLSDASLFKACFPKKALDELLTVKCWFPQLAQNPRLSQAAKPIYGITPLGYYFAAHPWQTRFYWINSARELRIAIETL